MNEPSFSSQGLLGNGKIITYQNMINRLAVIMANNMEWKCENVGEPCSDREGCQCDSCEGYEILKYLNLQNPL